MVVKCDPDERHQIGYLHTTFIVESGHKFKCECDPNLHSSNSTSAKRCIHFYSCLAVFLSDAKLSKEFDVFVQDDHIVTGMFISILTTNPEDGELLEIQSVDGPLDVHVALEDLVTVQEELPALTDLQPRQESWSAADWLSSVTEAINSSLYFGIKNQELVFQAPQCFFEVLKEKISRPISSKKRLPNSTQSYSRTKPPYGSFTKHVWLLNSLGEVKRVFDTPRVSLQLQQHYSRSSEGNFEPCASGEFWAFLKVGPQPLVIEWTPRLFPATEVGELVLRFECSSKKLSFDGIIS